MAALRFITNYLDIEILFQDLISMSR